MKKRIKKLLVENPYFGQFVVLRLATQIYLQNVLHVFWGIKLVNFTRSSISSQKRFFLKQKDYGKKVEFLIAMADKEYERGVGYRATSRLLVDAEIVRIQKQVGDTATVVSNTTLILDPGWVANVGHTASATVYSKAKMMGLIEHEVSIMYSNTANTELIRLLGMHLNITKLSQKHLSTLLLNFPNQFSAFGVFNFGKKGIFGEYEGQNMIEKMWDERKPINSPIYSREEIEIPLTESQIIDSRGFRDNPFVTFHIRNTSESTIRTANNVNPDTFVPAIEFMLHSGIRVALLGNNSAPHFKDSIIKHPLFWDYAHSDTRHSSIDIYLMSHAIFFVGTASGPIQIPNLFGVPILYTNQPHIACNYRLKGYVIPQLVKRTDSETPIDYSEMLQIPLGWSNREAYNNLERIRNSPGDILSGVKLMYSEWLDGSSLDNSFMEKEQYFEGSKPAMLIEPNFYFQYQNVFRN